MLYDGELQRLEALEVRLGTTFGQLTSILPTSVRSRTFDSPVAGTMPVPPRPSYDSIALDARHSRFRL